MQTIRLWRGHRLNQSIHRPYYIQALAIGDLLHLLPL